MLLAQGTELWRWLRLPLHLLACEALDQCRPCALPCSGFRERLLADPGFMVKVRAGWCECLCFYGHSSTALVVGHDAAWGLFPGHMHADDSCTPAVLWLPAPAP